MRKVKIYRLVVYPILGVLKGKAATDVRGSVEFVVCNDRTCLPTTEVEFKIAVGEK